MHDTCDLDKVEILGVEHKVRPTLSFSETFEFSGFINITPFPDPIPSLLPIKEKQWWTSSISC